MHIRYSLREPITNTQLNALISASWPNAADRDWQPVLERSLVYVCAWVELELMGFVHVAWDGGVHGFLLDTTVHPAYQRYGIGSELVRQAAEAATVRGLHWLHVDFEPYLREFYAGCGFQPTEAGLLQLNFGEH